MAHSRSSTHYDPHHNLLCVVSGCKRGIILVHVFLLGKNPKSVPIGGFFFFTFLQLCDHGL